MRKIVLSVLVVLVLIGTAFYMVNGMSKINVRGIKGISEKNLQLENKISELSNIKTVNYVDSETKLNKTASTLIDNKTEYENQATLSNLNKSNYATGLEAYDIDYLWTKLGNYAKEESVVIKIDVTAGGASSNLYNLNFSVGGSYVGATDFIYDIENDSKLGFKIDDFKMTANADAEIIATFTCKDIPLSVGNMEKTVQDPNNEQKNDNTNTTNTNSTGNTTNNKTNATTTSGNVKDYGMQDPNKSNLTSIDSVVDSNKLKE